MAAPTPTFGHRVEATDRLEGAMAVYKNGVEVSEGADFTRDGTALMFHEPLQCGRKIGVLGRLQMAVVGVGLYERIDRIDIHLTGADGRVALFTELAAKPGS